MFAHRKRLVLAAAPVLVLSAIGVAGVALSSGGSYTATPSGGSPTSFEAGSLTLDPWIDGKYYAWVPSPPPSDSGYYHNSGPPPNDVTFTGTTSGGTYTSTNPATTGSYAKK